MKSLTFNPFPSYNYPMGTLGEKKLPFGHIDALLYDVMIERCHKNLQDFLARNDRSSSTGFIENVLTPHFLDVKPLQEYTVLLLNRGLLQKFVKNIDTIKLPRNAADFIFSSEFLPEQDWGNRTKPRSNDAYSMPESVYRKALAFAQDHSYIAKTMHTIQTITNSHLENTRLRLLASSPNEIVVYPGHKIVEETLNHIANSSEKAFTNEMSPYVALAAGNSTQPAEHIFAHGLASAFQARAFNAQDEKKGPTECPFSSQIGHLWNTNIICNEQGVYKISPEKRAGAFPALIAGFVTGQPPKAESAPAATCPYSTRTP